MHYILNSHLNFKYIYIQLVNIEVFDDQFSPVFTVRNNNSHRIIYIKSPPLIVLNAKKSQNVYLQSIKYSKRNLGSFKKEEKYT